MSDSLVQADVYFRQHSASKAAGIEVKNGPGMYPDIGSVLFTKRQRCTVAEVNAGITLLAAQAGFKYRLVAASAIAIGGAAGAVTTVDILATQSAAGVKLVAFAQASLTQSTELKSGGSGAAILADGASYVQNDVNTAITAGKTGASITTATHIDFILTFAVEE